MNKKINVTIFDTTQEKEIDTLSIPYNVYSTTSIGDNIRLNNDTYRIKRKTFDFDAEKVFLDVEPFIGNKGGY